MELTRDYMTTIVERINRDDTFVKALLDEANILHLSGEHDLANHIRTFVENKGEFLNFTSNKNS